MQWKYGNNLLMLCLILALPWLLGACLAQESPTVVPSVTPKVATIIFTEEPDTLNPIYTSTWFSAITRDLWLRGLWNFDDNNTPVLQVAMELPSEANGGITNGGKTITIRLRSDAIWSDGTPVTAEDFVFTYDMILSGQNAVESRYPYEDFVESVEVVDKQTLVINFVEPFAPWLTSIFDYVLPKHLLEPIFKEAGTLDLAEWNRMPTVGIGPYVVAEWESGSHIIFTRNEKWFGVRPAIDQIFVRIVPDDAAQVASIKAGDTDIGMFISYPDVPDIQTTGAVDIVPVLSGYVEGWFINFNQETGHPALQDVRVRQALVLATDRQRITRDLLLGLTEPATTFWATTAPYEDPKLRAYPYDPKQARVLLDEAGWRDSNGDGTRDKDGVELVLRYVTDERELRQDVQVIVQQMWAEVGIGSELIPYAGEMLWNSYLENGPLATGQYDIAQYSDGPGFPDAEASYYWRCSEIPTAENDFYGSNWQSYCNEELDLLLDAQATTMNFDARLQLYSQIEQIMVNEVIWIGLWKDPDLWAVNERLAGVKFSGATPFWNVEAWDIDQ